MGATSATWAPIYWRIEHRGGNHGPSNCWNKIPIFQFMLCDLHSDLGKKQRARCCHLDQRCPRHAKLYEAAQVRRKPRGQEVRLSLKLNQTHGHSLTRGDTVCKCHLLLRVPPPFRRTQPAWQLQLKFSLASRVPTLVEYLCSHLCSNGADV